MSSIASVNENDELASRCESLALSEIASSADVSSVASFPVYDWVTNVDLSELKNLLAQLIKSKKNDLVQACRNYDRRSTSKISKSQLKQVIRMFCLPISSVQFGCLLKELSMNADVKIYYHHFFSQLSGTKVVKYTKFQPKLPDIVPIDEIELKIKEKIKKNLRNVIRSFWLFDINKDGFIQKAELRRIIRNYCFELSDDVYDEFWKSYDPQLTGLVSYKDFLIRLGVSADRYEKFISTQTAANSLCWKENKRNEGHLDKSWEQKCKRAAIENRDDPAIQGLPLEEILIILMERLKRQSSELRDVFKVFDSEEKGGVSLSDFRRIINLFVLAMSTNVFNQVMKKLEIDVSSDALDYEQFLNDFCRSSTTALSTRKSKKLDVCAPVVQQIRNSVLNPEARLRSVFTKINTDQEWQVTRPELKKALETGLDYKLTNEEFKELTTVLDPGNTNIINCVDFIHLFENSCDGDGIENEPKEEVNIEKYSNLTGRKLRSRLKHHLNKNIKAIEKAILVCDSDQGGFIAPEKLKNILSTFCFPLSESQFEDILSDIRKYGSTINYHEFLTFFKKSPDEDAKKWTALVDKLVEFKSRCPPEMLLSEVKEMMTDCICSRKTAMLKDLKALDVCNVGVVCKDDFRNILSKFVFRLNDKQFEALWETFPRNQYNQLLYNPFLEVYTSTKQAGVDSQSEAKTEPVPEAEQKKEVLSVREKRKTMPSRSTGNRKTTKEIFYSQAPPQLKELFEKMEPTIVRNFRAIRFHLRRADPKLTDRVDFVTLKGILAKSGIHFSSEEEFRILEHFDVRLTGKINYRDFLRVFVWHA